MRHAHSTAWGACWHMATPSSRTQLGLRGGTAQNDCCILDWPCLVCSNICELAGAHLPEGKAREQSAGAATCRHTDCYGLHAVFMSCAQSCHCMFLRPVHNQASTTDIVQFGGVGEENLKGSAWCRRRSTMRAGRAQRPPGSTCTGWPSSLRLGASHMR